MTGVQTCALPISGKRQETKMKYGPVRDATGKIVMATVFKSYSSRR